MKLYPIKTISCKKQECVFLDHFGKDIDDSADGLILCILCQHKVTE